jgi:hypothetical protein
MPTPTEPAIAALLARRAELAARLDELERRARPIRADILHLNAAIAIMRGSAGGPRLRAQQRPAWIADLGRLILGVLRGAPEPMTARAIAIEVMRLAGNDVGDEAAVQVVEHRVRPSLSRRVGIVERVALGTHRKGWRVAG